MFEEINEIVEVSVVFKKNKTIPTALKWNNRVFQIKKINMVHHTFDGDARIYYFAVSDDLNYFKLAFNTKTMQWSLEQVYTEG